MSLLRQAARLHSLYILALPGIGGLLGIYGVYDFLQYGHYLKALWALVVTCVFFTPLVLALVAEVSQKRLLRWLEANTENLVSGEAIYRGVKISTNTEVIVFSIAVSVILASFKIPSQMLIVGRDRIWLWRTIYCLVSFVFGWWGIPWGPVYTVQSLTSNLRTTERGRLIDMIRANGWKAGGGAYEAILPKP